MLYELFSFSSLSVKLQKDFASKRRLRIVPELLPPFTKLEWADKILLFRGRLSGRVDMDTNCRGLETGWDLTGYDGQ